VLRTLQKELAVGKAFASVLGDPPGELKLFFAFRWTGIRNRRLVGWTRHYLDIGSITPSRQDDAVSFVELSPTANQQEIAEKTAEVMNQLTTAFGHQLGIGFIQAEVTKLLQRKL
jgi:hypothetical protein